jgi:uncharacterized GH25 family protein
MKTRIHLFVVLVLTIGWTAYAGVLRGKVVLPDGVTPAKGMLILVEPLREKGTEATTIRATTGDDGTFAVNLVKDDGESQMTVWDGTNRLCGGFSHVKFEDLGTIKIKEPGEISGTVLTKDSAPLPDAEVTFDFKLERCTHYRESCQGKTDAKGAFSITNLAQGEYTYKVHSANFACEAGDVQVSEDPAFIQIRTRPGATLRGKVSDETGKPIQGITVKLDGDYSAQTDDQGSYAIRGLLPENYSISAEGKGYILSEHSLSVKLKEGQDLPKDLKVTVAGSLALKLVLSDPELKLGDSIEVNIGHSQNNGYTSDERSIPVKGGIALRENMIPGKYDVAITGDEMTSDPTNITLVGGQIVTQVVTISRAYAADGSIFTPDGTPATNASIRLRLLPPEKKADSAGRTASRLSSGDNKYGNVKTNGQFRIAGIRTGRYEATVTDKTLLGTNLVIEVTNNVTLPPFTLTMGHWIRGTVLQADGKPATEIRVNASRVYSSAERSKKGFSYGSSSSRSTKTDMNGAFEVTGLDDAKYSLRFSRSEPGNSDEVASMDSVPADSEDVMVSIARSREIAGTVADSEGKPIKDFNMSIMKKSGNRTSTTSRSRTPENEDGSFKLNLTEGALYTITVSKYPYVEQSISVDLTSTAPPQTGTLAIVMQPGATVRGTVTYKNDKPVKGVSVQAATENGRLDYSWHDTSKDSDDKSAGPARPKPTDEAGRFEVRGVATGIVTLHVLSAVTNEYGSVENRELASKQIMVHTSLVTGVHIELPATGNLNGRVLDEKGAPIAECQVSASSMPTDGEDYTTMTHRSANSGEDGSFLMTDLPEGSYMVSWFPKQTEAQAGRLNYRSSTPSEITVLAGQTNMITLGRSNAPAISGRLVMDGKPAGQGNLELFPSGTDVGANGMRTLLKKMIRTEVASNGFFMIENAVTGRYAYVYAQTPEDSDERGASRTPDVLSGTVEIGAGQTSLVITVSGIMISGLVTKADGSPVPGTSVSFTPAGNFSLIENMIPRSGVADEKGMYSVRGLKPDTYNVTAINEESALTKLTTVVVSAKATNFDLLMELGVTLEGKVSQSDGNPCQGASVVLVDTNNEARGFGFSDAVGNFAVSEPVSKALYTAFAFKKGYAIEKQNLDLATETNCSFALSPGGDLVVSLMEKSGPATNRIITVKDEKDVAIPRVSVSGARSLAMLWYSDWLVVSPTDAKGKTTVKGLLPGKYTVTVKGSRKTGKVEIKPLANAELTIKL